MGVKGLWRLLLPIGRRISIETLEGKRLAIDVSIWMTQFLKAGAGRGESEGTAVSMQRYLVIFFKRLCKLRYHGIRPIFVFDGGRMPELKRRELQLRQRRRDQFRAQGQQAEVARMARRLLLQTLKKQKSKTTSTAEKPSSSSSRTTLAPGFNLLEEETEADAPAEPTSPNANSDHNEKFDPKNNSSQNKNSSKPQNEQSVAAAGSDPPAERDDKKQAEEDEALLVSILHDEQEYPMQDNESSEQVNDWDAFDSTPDAETQQHQDDEQAADLATSSCLLDVEHVASLTPMQRKDAIETAQRRQRMRSRREFMPVAANPETYSQTQLRNFLRSSRLNQAIQKVGTTVVERGIQLGQGEHVASDRRRRVTFIKESEEQKKEPSGAKAAATLEDSSDDDEGGFVRTVGEVAVLPTAQQASSQAKVGTSAVRGAVLESSDEEEQGGSIRDDTKVEAVLLSTATKSGSRAKRIALSESSEDEAGGFIPEDSDIEVVQTRASSQAKVNPLSNKNVDAFRKSASPERAQDEDGGFIRENCDVKVVQPEASSLPKSLVAGVSQSSVGEEGGFIREDADVQIVPPTVAQPYQYSNNAASTSSKDRATEPGSAQQGKKPSSDAIAAQELEDELLAQAIQNAEIAEAAHEDHGLEHVHNVSQDFRYKKKGGDGAEITEKSRASVVVDLANGGGESEDDSARGSVVVDLAAVGDSEDDSDVEWEDGEQKVAEDQEVLAAGSVGGEADLPSISEKGIMKTTPGENGTVEPLRNEDSSEEDGLEWEEGDLNGEEDRLGQSDDCGVVTAGDTSVENESSVSKGGTASTKAPLVFSSSESGDFHRESRADEKATADAWQHAQETAANLTNWAGRAFRRAIASHMEETEQKEKTKQKGPDLTNDTHSPSPPSSPVDVPVDVPVDNESTASSHGRGESLDHAASPSRISPGHSSPSSKRSPGDSWSKSSTQNIDSRRQPRQAAVSEAARDEALRSLEISEEQWAKEMKRKDRDAEAVTDEIRAETINLLQLFGVPFVVSPSEAEAQCATLEALGLVDGIVTEDSDVFVFGGKTVYKNIFDDQKYVEVYRSDDAEKEMSLNRNAMVALAMLLGGDYTEGVKGVGIVNGMEILEAFNVAADLHDGLTRFRKWLDGFDPSDALGAGKRMKSDRTDKEQQFHIKHRSARNRWTAPGNFPSEQVITAYTNPVVDNSRDEFSWDIPDAERLLVFCNRNLGWSFDDTRNLLNPVIQRIEGRFRQTRIDSFMRYEDDIKFAKVRSNRLKDVFKAVQSRKKKASNSSDGGKDEMEGSEEPAAKKPRQL